ncbi:hypothetical protein Phi4:1_gp114 [Cellulophaga phage phi4:1]|jgi:hypothetical protein|uniref:Uncharacterized protein n=3 Tax=Lightbulbvirus Cba41 TaxID=1918524 RepID=A0A0S2MWL1_9CAUD|nr:hypothetical protein Phi4:1_gp114 [Cellulophaga phage phi4:1]AGO49527.1 hypothetical protein Phi4:1_gp114 [Cellulophaga phage phi4:1]ALO80123.1 hypothetical protein Phi4113_114 [Cellulophaga phage phi4:1_13]ALO80320.1 hypothetical protein Phi4118_114 [Cellulophaga phage phi4:1_18]
MKNAPLSDLILLLFIGLKLTNEIDWNWILVLSPFILKVIYLTYVDFKRNKVKPKDKIKELINNINKQQN